jgi:hypothetical protein
MLYTGILRHTYNAECNPNSTRVSLGVWPDAFEILERLLMHPHGPGVLD